MEAAVVVVPPAVPTDAAGSAAAPCAPASGYAPAQPFGAVLQQKVNGQQVADETRAEPEKQDGGNQAAKPDKEAGEAGSADAQELVVQGGINITLPGSSEQSGTGSAGQSGDGAAQAVVEMTGGAVPAESQAAEAGFPAKPAASQVSGDAAPGDAEAKLAAMQAKVHGTQPQIVAAEGSTEPAGEAQVKGGAQQSSPTGPGSVQADENLNLTQAPDRGAAVEAAVMSSAAVAKEEAGQKAAAEVGRGKFEVINPEAATEKSKGKDAGQPAAAVKSQEALPEKAAEMRPVQSSSQTGTEHSQPPLAAAAPDRAGAGLESVPARETADAGKAAEPPVSRQQIMDQVVRSARLNLERGMSRFKCASNRPAWENSGWSWTSRTGR